MLRGLPWVGFVCAVILINATLLEWGRSGVSTDINQSYAGHSIFFGKGYRLSGLRTQATVSESKRPLHSRFGRGAAINTGLYSFIDRIVPAVVFFFN